MTQLLVRVANAGEAAVAASAGVDIVEMRLGAPRIAEFASAKSVRLAVPGVFRLSFDGPASADDMVEDALFIGADELLLALDASPSAIQVINTGRLTAIALLPVTPDFNEALQRIRRRVGGVMIQSGRAARLLDCAGIAQLAAMAEACRAAGLPFGFSGGLEAPDIPRLLLLRPNVLGFDTAVRADHRADGTLLPHCLEAIRALIPRDGSVEAAMDGAAVLDTIFVRDFAVALSIGAYRNEERARQRVRFCVDAVIARRTGPPRDMRDVVSYDLILETIRVLAERDHVTFVETLAEEIAVSLLAHVAIRKVTVSVEKLDVIDGTVGITIVRQRPT